MTDTYQPGVCNIGPAEIRMRRRAGIASLDATVAVMVAFVAFDVPAEWRWLVALPAAGAAFGFLQAQLHFCVAFGMSGLFNFGTLGTQESVLEAEFRKKDQRKAIVIAAGSLLVAFVVGAAAVLLA